MRQSFIFYRSFYESISELSNEQKGAILSAICEYSLNNTEPDFNGIEKVIFTLIKPQIDANTKRYDNGIKGGRPKKNNQTETKQKPNRNQTETKSEPNKNDNVNVNDNYNKNVNKNKKDNVSLDELSISHISDWLSKKQEEGFYEGIDPNHVLGAFKDYCLANNPKYKDYVAAFRNSFEWSRFKEAPKKKPSTGALTL